MTDSDRHQPRGLFKPASSLSKEDAHLVSLYRSIGRTLDDLPYTPEFERLFEEARIVNSELNERATFWRLLNLRKAGDLPRVGPALGRAPAMSDEEEQLLAGLVSRKIERLSMRDKLPYTSEFEEIVSTFNAATGLSMSPHDVWRVIAKLAK